jgi:hypothetical protein
MGERIAMLDHRMNSHKLTETIPADKLDLMTFQTRLERLSSLPRGGIWDWGERRRESWWGKRQMLLSQSFICESCMVKHPEANEMILETR